MTMAKLKSRGMAELTRCAEVQKAGELISSRVGQVQNCA